MKLSLQNAVMILAAGMLLILTGWFLNLENARMANPTIMSGLAIEFIGTIWLVLYLSRRRRKN